ncbi:MAG: TRAP transporter large permease [Paracoccaceae bacterium]|nr:MAG: TRAP transporter large permease [Paracoccaceae bacterium]
MVGVLFSSFLILLVLGVPIAFAIGLGALVPIILQGNIPLSLVVSRMFGGIDSFPLMAIPFFVLTGTLAGACQLTDRIAALAAFMVGRMRAGLAHVNIVASMLFGGVTGSAVADAAATGSMMIPAMKAQGYPAGYSAAVTAASSVIGSIIPPSTLMIIYGYLTGVSTGRMFLGGVIPGVLIGLALMLVAHFQAVRLGIGYDADAKPRDWGTLPAILRDAGPAMLVPVVIIGGIVGGFFTPTEAGVVAVVTILLVGTFVYRSFTWAGIRAAFLSAGYTTAMVMMILAASTVFANLLTRARFQTTLIDMLSSVSPVPEVQMLLVIAALLFLTLFIDATAVLIMFAAPLAAVCAALGYDPVHSGIVIVVACLIGGVTPPVGTLLFIAAGIARISVAEASRAILPFVLALIAVNVLIMLIPFLVTWLPSIAFG